MSNIKICLDAGHYGKYNRSPVVPEYYESDFTWKYTNIEKEIFEQKYGITVVLTRNNQATDLDLFSRGMKSKGCDLFISNHSNACGTESVDHPAAIHFVPDGKITIDEKSKEIAQILTKVVADIMQTTQPGTAYSRLSAEDRDRNGILDDEYYGVLNGAKQARTPGIIMEHSFHTNTRAAKWLLDDNNLRKMAEAECKAIADWLGVKEKIVENPTNTQTGKSDGKLYRVQIGAFLIRSNANKQLAKVRVMGFGDAFITKSGLYYKVQVGAYGVKQNAENMMSKVKSKGFDAIIVEVTQ